MVISRDLGKEELMRLKFYRSDAYRRYILKTQPIADAIEGGDKELIDFVKDNDISLVDTSVRDIVDASNFMVNEKGYESCLIEGGISSYREYLENEEMPAPSDVFMLTVLKGKTGNWLGH